MIGSCDMSRYAVFVDCRVRVCVVSRRMNSPRACSDTNGLACELKNEQIITTWWISCKLGSLNPPQRC